MEKQVILKQAAKKHGINLSGIPLDQLAKGIKVEKEHDTNDDVDVVKSPVDLIKIAVAHLREDPQYYTKLKTAKLEEIKLLDLINNITEGYSKKLVDDLVTLYSSQTDLDVPTITTYINRFGDLKDAIRKKFEDESTRELFSTLIPQDLQNNNLYLDIQKWKNFDDLKRVVDGASKKAEDIYKKAIGYFKRKNPEGNEAAIKSYVNRFKRIVIDLKNKVEAKDEAALNAIPKHLLDQDKYLTITNWDNFRELENLLDTVYPVSSNKSKPTEEINTGETDADRIYKSGDIEVYKADSEHKCVRYGRNQYYSWCISYTGGRSLYYDYRLGRYSSRPLMFYFVMDRSQTDEKKGNRFVNPYHIVVIHAMDNEKYTVTTADNDADQPNGGTKWENLGRYFKAPNTIYQNKDNIDQGQHLWSKIKDLKHLFKYIKPTKEELRYKELKGKKYSLQEYGALTAEDKKLWLSANASTPGVITSEILRSLDAGSKNLLINHGKKFKFNDLKSNKGLLRRYADVYARKYIDNPEYDSSEFNLPVTYVPYLEREDKIREKLLIDAYYKKYVSETLDFEDIVKYFPESYISRYIDEQIKTLDWLPPEAEKHMSSKQKSLYKAYSASFLDANLEYSDDAKLEDGEKEKSGLKSLAVGKLSFESFNKLDGEERKKWISLVKKVGSTYKFYGDKDSQDPNSGFLLGVPIMFLINGKLYFWSQYEPTKNKLESSKEFWLFDENGKVLIKGTKNLLVHYKNNDTVETDGDMERPRGFKSVYVTEKDFDSLTFTKMDDQKITLKPNDFQNLKENLLTEDWFKHSIMLKAGIIQ